MSKKETADKQRAGFKKDNAILKKTQQQDSVKRYAYLLGQTDIFAHFLNLKKQKEGSLGEEMGGFEAAMAANSTKKARLTEAEEDANLQKDDEDVPDTIELTESPSCLFDL
jgi:hypothetical protein